jgi:hypothetical protein
MTIASDAFKRKEQLSQLSLDSCLVLGFSPSGRPVKYKKQNFGYKQS